MASLLLMIGQGGIHRRLIVQIQREDEGARGDRPQCEVCVPAPSNT